MQASLAFTPRDTIALWDAFEKAGLPKERIKDLDPKVSIHPTVVAPKVVTTTTMMMMMVMTMPQRS